MPFRGRTSQPGKQTLTALLSRQSGSFQRDPAFIALARRLETTPALQLVRLNSIAWRLLNTPRLKIEYLDNFYRTYRLPRDRFFRDFLEIKWNLIDRKKKRRQERAAKIAAAVTHWPPEVRATLAYLAAAEKTRQARQPLTADLCAPTTIKRAVTLGKMQDPEWIAEIDSCIQALRRAYPRLGLPPATVLLDCALLNCLPENGTTKLPPPSAIRARFRSLSKATHPDTGGDAASFRQLKAARDRLLKLSEPEAPRANHSNRTD